MTQQDNDRWLTIPEACQALGKTDRTIRRWVSTGKLQSVKMSGIVRVCISDKSPARPDTMSGEGHDVLSDFDRTLLRQRAELEARVQSLEQTIADMAGQIANLSADKNYLQEALQREQQLRLAELSQRQIGATVAENRKPRWKFWQRSPE